ncbi:MAG: hypothetical protein RPS47_00535 [Colwellia sp.]
MHTDEFKKKTILEWKESGLTQKAFCQKTSLNVHTLHYWIRQLKDKENLK